MTSHAGSAGQADTADQLMRHALNELDAIRRKIDRDAAEIRRLRSEVREKIADTEKRARAHVNGFTPDAIGRTLQTDLKHQFRYANFRPPAPAPRPLPANLDEARREWRTITDGLESRIDRLVAAKVTWDAKIFKRKADEPRITDELWQALQRLDALHTALPELRERYVAEQLDGTSHLRDDLAADLARRARQLEQAVAEARAVFASVENAGGRSAGAWGTARWSATGATAALERSIRLGEIVPPLPSTVAIDRIPVLTRHPFGAGLAISAEVDSRHEAVDLVRAVTLRTLAATPAGAARFLFVDPVSLGQSVSEFRHLAEFDERLVDAKTWTSEREIETRLDELSSHLEVVISTYLRGQFDSIEEYNEQAGEVAEAYRFLVVLDYPSGFTNRSARQLLSLIENGPRCGVHVVLHHDPARGSFDDVPLERLTHSMQRVSLAANRSRITLPEPIGALEAEFIPDACPPLTFSADGRPLTPGAELLVNIGEATRSSESDAVTLERVVPLLRRQIATGRAIQAPVIADGAPDLALEDASTWWQGVTATGAAAPIGRAGAQGLASLYFSSTEVAGGAIIVGLPRTGKSTALHAAIMSLAILYPPDELELYLVDSKHGVEFKTYEFLPHARLVSINSEREFSVNVLQTLDGEIKRRAELMKAKTAGRANITEYREATGEVMPRIVVFLDEFHELFEEDDSLGRAAFHAFSNIVRQGPFAGVHLVVASQTLSSMPAMDRSTLSLLPMRVAFMCNEGDADLVMGDQNREVRMLSQQGEGILNPARGEPSHNQLFRGTYVPADERNALLDAIERKARAEGVTRRPRVFDGDTLARRPDGSPGGSAIRPIFGLGEPFDLDMTAGLSLRRSRASNVLLLGAPGDEPDADPSVIGAVQSCLVDASRLGMTATLIDFVGDAEPVSGLDLLDLCGTIGAGYKRASGLAAALVELREEIASRREAEDYRRPGRLLVLHGLQRAFDLTPDDPYGETTDGDGAALAAVLRDGPEVGCHTVVSVDGATQLERKLGRELTAEFGWRVIAADVSSQDVSALTGRFDEAPVRAGQLLIVDHAGARSRRVRAYPRHTELSAAEPDRTAG